MSAHLDSLELTRRLIAFDTTSRGSNLALIDFAQDLLEEAGGRCRRTVDAGGNKANLFATLGPDRQGGTVLSGHTDVVPVDGQEWSCDPFQPEVRDGKLNCRGACDMKGFIGVALSRLPNIARAKLAHPIRFALSYDEEVGCTGVRELLADLAAHDIRPELAIIGEPTLMKVVGAHKAGAVLHTHCHGREGHSSAPEKGANAVMMAGEFVRLLQEMWDELRADADPAFDPPHTTLQANMIEGGSASNILARDARVTWEYRALPGRDADAIVQRVRERAEREILAKYRKRAPEARLETILHASYPGLVMDEASPAVRVALALSGANHAEAVSYGTEAGHFQRAGIPSVICGPGSIEQAHKADEFVALAQLEACGQFLDKVIAKACVA